jgi:YD repeat-containing protein
MARLNSVQTKLATEAQQNPAWQSVISAVQFNAFGAVTSLNHLGVTESRSYNVLGQMTRMTKGSLIDVEYRFSATANDGKILSQKNWLSGEDVTYQYDELERLISASTTAGTSWGLSWSYL